MLAYIWLQKPRYFYKNFSSDGEEEWSGDSTHKQETFAARAGRKQKVHVLLLFLADIVILNGVAQQFVPDYVWDSPQRGIDVSKLLHDFAENVTPYGDGTQWRALFINFCVAKFSKTHKQRLIVVQYKAVSLGSKHWFMEESKIFFAWIQ